MRVLKLLLIALGTLAFVVGGGAMLIRGLTTGALIGRHHHVIARAVDPAGYWFRMGLMAIGWLIFMGMLGLLVSAIANVRREDRGIRALFDRRRLDHPAQRSALDPSGR